ncbi:unnamed protein product [Rotaria socialis]|uniref:Uncharacterized protein n=2 Tax=Rotaria socialis TaxID=392032 RepID=A0A820P3S4_9BILA|nr:unnamed protein product [Rotaria socialis]
MIKSSIFQGSKDSSDSGFFSRFKRKKNTGLPKPFPLVTPQSYVPGSAAVGNYPYQGYVPPGGAGPYPPMNSNIGPPSPSYPVPYPNMNGPPPMPYPNMNGRPPMPYPNMNPMSMMQQPRGYGRPIRIRRRCHSRPTICIVRSDSCSSISTCETITPCCKRRYRSCSHASESRAPQQQQQIILVPVKCQQPQAITGTVQMQPQQTTLPTIQFQNQQQPFALPTILNTTAAPMILSGNQSMLQPTFARSQTVTFGQPQQIQAGSIQYVQAAPRSSSDLQLISMKPNTSMAPQRVLVNSTNKNEANVIKTISSSQSNMKQGQTR